MPTPLDLIAYHHPSTEKVAAREAALEKLREEADAPFMALSTDELLHELAIVGYAPKPGLIRTCLKRQGALVPGLLDLMARYGDPAWDDDDPRWYGPIHAGRLLIAFGEEKALPLFEKILREDEKNDDIALEWFEGELLYYGPVVVPMLTSLLQDEAATLWKRIAYALMLKGVAQLHPDVKPQVVEVLRAALPPLSERGDGTRSSTRSLACRCPSILSRTIILRQTS